MKKIYQGKNVVITGGSSGIGCQCAQLFALLGAKVYELSRSGHNTPYCTHINCDVTDEQSVKEAAAQVQADCGTVSVLINNAGFGISGAIEDTDTELAIQQLNVNFFGTVRVTKHFLPLIKQAKGVIVNLSSVAAVMPIPFQAYYSASKAAINSYTFALANELAPFGVRVCAVMPGDIATSFTQNRVKTASSQQYAKRTEKSVSQMEKDEQTGNKPIEIASLIAKVAAKRKVKPLYTGGAKYKLFVWLGRMLGAKTVNAVLGSMYAK